MATMSPVTPLMEPVPELSELVTSVAAHEIASHSVPAKLPSVPHVQIPPPVYPGSHTTITVSPVTPLIEAVVGKLELATSVAGHESTSHSEPVKSPSVPHVHVPPPLYPGLQATLGMSPVTPVMIPVVELSELATYNGHFGSWHGPHR
jgi:hypothetical protein